MFSTELVGVCIVPLVGGNWNHDSQAGLWCWNMNETSSNAWTNNGARLLNLKLGMIVQSFPPTCFGKKIKTRDLVCVGALMVFRLLLSAVLGIILHKLACGVGLSMKLRLIRIPIEVLDLLYGI